MAKKKVSLTEDQKRRNAEILRRLREEREKLWEDTRSLQRHWNDDKRIKHHTGI